MATQQGGVKILWARSTQDIASTATNASTDGTSITVTGAALGDPVFVGSDTAPPASGGFYAYVSAADTVKVRFLNVSAGTIDPASQVFTVGVVKLNDLA